MINKYAIPLLTERTMYLFMYPFNGLSGGNGGSGGSGGDGGNGVSESTRVHLMISTYPIVI